MLSGCVGSGSDSIECIGATEPFLPFTEWGACSVTCGDGIQTRVSVSSHYYVAFCLVKIWTFNAKTENKINKS